MGRVYNFSAGPAFDALTVRMIHYNWRRFHDWE